MVGKLRLFWIFKGKKYNLLADDIKVVVRRRTLNR